jgi:hypothetical protein
MTCSDTTCGTGIVIGSPIPLPGDPSNNAILQAVPAFGGIDVYWSYPGINPHAVAHTLLFRGTTNLFEQAVQLPVVNGSFFYDKLDTGTTYYYWIRFVSIQGTVLDPIGPASATAKPLIDDLMAQLTGRIDAGVLAQSLKMEIDRITLLDQAITQETSNRVTADGETTAMLSQIQADVDDAFAAIQTVTEAQASDTASLAQQITTVQTGFGEDLASVEETLQTNINTVNGKVTDIGALYNVRIGVNGLAGGFGVYNDGTEVEAGFDVDTFWVGRTGPDKIKPFIIEGGVVYINEAAINKLTFSKLRDASGAVVVEGGRIKAPYLKVEEASIETAAVTRLKIAGQSVTIPKFAAGGSMAIAVWDRPASAPSSLTNVLTVNFTLPEEADVLIIGNISFSSTGVTLDTITQWAELYADTTALVAQGGYWYHEGVTLVKGVRLAAGSHTASLKAAGNTGTVVDESTIFVLGAMR